MEFRRTNGLRDLRSALVRSSNQASFVNVKLKRREAVAPKDRLLTHFKSLTKVYWPNDWSVQDRIGNALPVYHGRIV
jgi:hypothetical protein